MPERLLVVRQIYATCAVLVVVGSLVPMFADPGVDEPGLVHAAVTEENGFAVLGVLLAVAVCVLALRGAARAAHDFATPTTLLVVGAVALVLLVARPGTGASPAALGVGAWMLIGATAVLLAAALVDVLHVPTAAGRPAPVRVKDEQA